MQLTPTLRGGAVHSPSGHTASAAIIYGGLSVLLSSWPLRCTATTCMRRTGSRISLGAMPGLWRSAAITVGCSYGPGRFNAAGLPARATPKLHDRHGYNPEKAAGEDGGVFFDMPRATEGS